MARIPPSEKTRNTNLNALQSAVDEWAETEITRLDNETIFLRAVLKGRKASDVGAKNLDQASKLLQSEIAAFLRTG